MSNATNADLNDNQGIGTILNDDPQPGGDDVGETPGVGGLDDEESPGNGGGDEGGEMPTVGDETHETIHGGEGVADGSLFASRSIAPDITGTSGSDRLTETNGDDNLFDWEGTDVLTGGEGFDRFVYTSPDDGLDILTDFALGRDRIDLSHLGIDETHLRFADTVFGTLVSIDPDGSGLRGW